MSTRQEKIAHLTDQQALSIVDSLAGEFADADTPERKEDQAQALQTLLSQQGETLDVSRIAEADTTTAAQVARQLLMTMTEVPELQPSLDEWLDTPPTQEAAAIPLLLAAPIVLTGCIVVLQVAGHITFKRHPDGKWEFGYDPTKQVPLDKTMKDIVKALVTVMRLPNAGS